jgi:hypothetical protein
MVRGPKRKLVRAPKRKSVRAPKRKSVRAPNRKSVRQPKRKLRPRVTGLPYELLGIGAGGGKVLAVGSNRTETDGAVLSSSDGITWSPQLIAQGEQFRDVTWFTFEGVAPRFVVVGDQGTIATSADGVSWTLTAGSPSRTGLAHIASGVGIMVVTILTPPPQVYTSTDGVTWTLHSSVAPQVLIDVTYGLISGQTGFVAVGEYGLISTSFDGSSWTTRRADSRSQPNLLAIVWSGPKGLFVAGGFNGAILTSPDGVTWTQQTSPTTSPITAIAWSGSRFVGLAGSEIIYSTDGINWTIQPTITGDSFNDIIWWNGMFIAVSSGISAGVIMRSADGINWTT